MDASPFYFNSKEARFSLTIWQNAHLMIEDNLVVLFVGKSGMMITIRTFRKIERDTEFVSSIKENIVIGSKKLTEHSSTKPMFGMILWCVLYMSKKETRQIWCNVIVQQLKDQAISEFTLHVFFL